VYASRHAAGCDLFATRDLAIRPGETVVLPLDLIIALPAGTEAQIRPRSGLALKHGISVLNSPGTIDAGYRGEVRVILLNTSNADFPIKRGDRIAQMVIQKLPEVELVQVGELSESKRGAGGFGSTGVG
jgi:dUTP pyrophosphatase